MILRSKTVVQFFVLITLGLLFRILSNSVKPETSDYCTENGLSSSSDMKKILSKITGDMGNEQSSKKEPTLESFGYHFVKATYDNDPENQSVTVLRQDNGKGFEFDYYKGDMGRNQERYEAIGEVITEYVYKFLEEDLGLRKVTIPKDAEPKATKGFFFMSKDALVADKLMILIHGSGVVRAGQWARSLIINVNLECGSMVPYIERAKNEGYGVLITNGNQNYGYSRKSIKGSESPQEHFAYVWKHFIKDAKAKDIVVVAHSFGGVVVLHALRVIDEALTRIKAVAFTDSVHSVSGKEPKKIRNWFKENAKNWVSSSDPLDTPVHSYYRDSEGSPLVSAGTTEHVWTSHCAKESVFKFFDEKLKKLKSPAKRGVDAEVENMSQSDDVEKSDSDSADNQGTTKKTQKPLTTGKETEEKLNEKATHDEKPAEKDVVDEQKNPNVGDRETQEKTPEINHDDKDDSAIQVAEKMSQSDDVEQTNADLADNQETTKETQKPVTTGKETEEKINKEVTQEEKTTSPDESAVDDEQNHVEDNVELQNKPNVADNHGITKETQKPVTTGEETEEKATNHEEPNSLAEKGVVDEHKHAEDKVEIENKLKVDDGETAQEINHDEQVDSATGKETGKELHVVVTNGDEKLNSPVENDVHVDDEYKHVEDKVEFKENNPEVVDEETQKTAPEIKPELQGDLAVGKETEKELNEEFTHDDKKPNLLAESGVEHEVDSQTQVNKGNVTEIKDDENKVKLGEKKPNAGDGETPTDDTVNSSTKRARDEDKDNQAQDVKEIAAIQGAGKKVKTQHTEKSIEYPVDEQVTTKETQNKLITEKEKKKVTAKKA